MNRIMLSVLSAAAAIGLPSAAHAGELIGGIYKHAVGTRLSLDSGLEDGVDFQLGYRGSPIIKGIGLSPYVFGALNSNGDTSYAAAGLSWKFGDAFYVRPGVGLAIHNGSDGDYNRGDRIAFGSRILFAPELGVGVRVSPRMTVEASWVHMSHGGLFNDQNPGIDNIGVRFNLTL